MPPRPFYSIPESSFLFGRKHTPEEEVRQWAIFELLGTYKWPITSLQIEFPVQIGSRDFRADIVVLDNSIPLAVVECKKREHKFSERDFRQAYSYADSVQARFSVLTNGQMWLTARKIGKGWEPVTDIPKLEQFHLTQTQYDTPSDRLHSLFWSIHGLQALLYWLYRPIPNDEVRLFANNLHTFFTSTDFDVDYRLEHIVKNMCSYLSNENFFSSGLYDEDGYAAHKLTVIYSDLQEYLQAKDGRIRERVRAKEFTIQQAITNIIIDLKRLHIASTNLRNAELYFGEFIVSLAGYFETVFEKRMFSEWASQFVQPFWNLIDTEFLPEFGAALPKSHDDHNVNVMRMNGQFLLESEITNPYFK